MARARPGRTKHALAAAVTVVVLAAAAFFVSPSCTGSTPPGQPPLVRLGTDITRFDADFHAACDQVRVLVLLSPT